MRIYTSRKQAEQIIVALMTTFGSQDEESLKLIQTINNALLLQCKYDKSHYNSNISVNKKSKKRA